ncbi:MAG TPA: hypothetical protein VF529_00200 [Solirubrobacteraceae bacterium]
MIASVLALLIPQVAPSRAVAADIGISESEPSFIDNSYFRELVSRHKPRLVRGVFAWDVATLPLESTRRQWLKQWLAAVRAARAEPFVALNWGGSPNHGPSRTAYEAAFRQFIAVYGTQLVIAPWNEPNRKGKQKVGPRRAAVYFRTARKVCPTCRLVAGEFAGSKKSLRYVRRYMRRLRLPREVVGIHVHGDTRRFQLCSAPRKALRDDGVHRFFDFKRKCRGSFGELTRFFSRLLPNRRLWITEAKSYRRLPLVKKRKNRKTGKKEKVRKLVYFSERMQCRATAFIQSLPDISAAHGRIERVYHYRFDDSYGHFFNRRPERPPKVRVDTDEGLVKRDGEPVATPRGRPIRQRDAFYNVKHEDKRCRPHPYAKRFSPVMSWRFGFGGGLDTRLMADPTGDGKADAVLLKQDGSWHVATSTGRSFDNPAQWISGHGEGSETKGMLDDVNGDDNADGLDDNRADAVVFKDGSWDVALSSGSSFGTPSQWIADYGERGDMVTLSDVTGDGRSDAIVHKKDKGEWYVASSTGTSFGPPSLWISGHGDAGSDEQMMDDVNGDDLPDAVVYDADGGRWRVAVATRDRDGNPTSFAQPTDWAFGLGVGSEKQTLDDANGDNLADAIVHYENGGSWHAALSTETSFFAPDLWLKDFGIGAATHFVADANGDDRGDAAVFNADGSWQVVPASPAAPPVP